MTLWRSFVAWLAAMSADPSAIDAEMPRAHASYRLAYATFAPADDLQPGPVPTPPAPPAPRPTRDPAPKACRCGGPCSPACSCGCSSVLSPVRTPCPDGKCPLPSGQSTFPPSTSR